MHEWALAESVIYTVAQEAEKEKLKEITAVKIMIGELQQIDLNIFKLALENILQLSALQMDFNRIAIEIDPSFLKCKVCGNEWSYSEAVGRLPEPEAEAIHFIPEMAHIYLRCPACGSPDFELAKGRGVWIEYIEGEK
ncbi:MAG: hydrogenase nickel incorporation protein HypA [Desulfotomaculaceae bacterium]|nr:hydrogenase nickel incorporation protein HypA [Desulfotomaculaceae bacterium]